MKVYWTESAIAHLDAIYAYIFQDSPEFALRVIDRLTSRSQQIASFPLSGRKVPEYDVTDIREVIESNYRIIYHITSTQIEVVALLHCARKSL